MATEVEFLYSLGVLLPMAVILSMIFARIRLPLVPAQILAGMALGPYALGVLTGLETLNLLASLGVVFLMFFIGLELDPEKLTKIGFKVIPLAAVEMAIASSIGFVIAVTMGFPFFTSIFFASTLGFTSTAVVGKLLLERGMIRGEIGHMVMGLLIIEDIVAIFLIFLLPELALFGRIEIGVIMGLLLRGAVLFGLIILFSLTVAPRLINYISKFELEFSEITLLGAISFGVFFSYVSVIFGFSPAIGAFLTGLMIRGKQSRFLSAKVVPIKDLLVVLFFVSMGTLIQPKALILDAIPLIILGMGALAGKIIGSWVITHVTGIETSTRELGLILTPRGEFSLALAREGAAKGVVDPSLVSITGALTILTALTSALGLRVPRGRGKNYR